MKRFALPIGVFLLIIAYIVLGTGTRGGLGYFAPDTLEFESRSEYTILSGSVPIYRSARQPETLPLLDYLRQSGYVPIRSGPPRKWNEECHWNSAWKDGYSTFHRALTRESEERISWSKAHPERAKLYWSTVFRWMRSDQERENWAATSLLQCHWRNLTLQELPKVIADIESENNIPHSPPTLP